MRELKFRVWDKRFKQFIDDKNYESDEIIFAWTPFGILSPKDYQNDIEIQQFTGLKDKNNKDIYEGDIIKVSELNNNQQAGPGKRQILQTFDKAIVTFNNGCYYYNPIRSKGHNIPHGLLYYGYEKEIIGNIFEIPDLL